MSPRKLTLDDILDLRAYERTRDEFRRQIIDLKARRRLMLGTFVSIVFENRETIRSQIQEMARAEKLSTDEEIQIELDIYNPMIPEPGRLCATLFIELTNDDSMREWLPRLVGMERSIAIRLCDGSEIRSYPESQHENQLTREDTTSAVHYLHFDVTEAQIETLASSGGVLVCDHPDYQEEIDLSASNVAELVADLRS
ncbi:MAG: DUF3501 family protein [Actinomycetota bacterium]|nr:DUF3501 family protein [Actinomycetota bacterium]MDA2971119.1 DUF3501 family protein [Actinomycetota bacterium]MDA3000870.1 DUF3501 family protein [Actinomycetota bacterium]